MSKVKEIRSIIKKGWMEERFKLHPAYEIASYFREALKKAGYTITQKNWEKTKEASKKVLMTQSHIPVSEWKECIDWCFGPQRMQDSFWSKVLVLNFETVVKIFNTFKTYKLASGYQKDPEENSSKRRIRYGRLKYGAKK